MQQASGGGHRSHAGEAGDGLLLRKGQQKRSPVGDRGICQPDCSAETGGGGKDARLSEEHERTPAEDLPPAPEKVEHRGDGADAAAEPCLFPAAV